MHVHPDIAALRSDRAPQRQAQTAIQAACAAWSAEPGAAEMKRELDAFGGGAALEDCPQLEAVFTGSGEAERLIGLMSHHVCTTLKANIYGHPPFRNGYDGNAGSMLLARTGRAQLLIQAREPGTFAYDHHLFSDALRYDAVIGGLAQARIVRITSQIEDSASFSSEEITLRPGCRLAFDLASETMPVERIDQRLVVLRLVRTRKNPQPAREYHAESGTLIHQSAGSLASSRQEAIIALLGRMGRTDAAPAFARLAQGDGDASLRWQALRECLALDSVEGFIALTGMARSEGDQLARSAGALRAQLIEQYPQFLAMEAQ